MIRRRDFIKLLGGAATAWPLAARAQRQAIPLVGYLGGATQQASERFVAAFRKGLSETGYVEHQNVTVEYRFGDGHYDRLPALAAELAGRQPAVIYAEGIPSARAVKSVTTTIPIVFAFGEDPVQEGIVDSMNKPSANITGFSHFTNQLIGKRLALLCEIVPQASALAYLTDANNPISEPDAKAARVAAAALGRQLDVMTVANACEVEGAFTTMAQRKIEAVTVDPAPFFLDVREEITSLAAGHRIPAIYDQSLFTQSGGLASYGADRVDAARQAGAYAGRILNGAKPAELPVQQATKIEFVINLKTAKALGLYIPPTVVARADEVIE